MASEDRPQYQHGVGTIGSLRFHWGSGTPGRYWSVPYGDYPVTPDAPTGDWAHRVGAIPIANNVIPDPLLGRNRIGIMIHSGSASSLDALYTQGCFKVAPSEWPAVREEILKEAKSGPLYLHVQPGGVASFTNTKTFEQTNIPTATAPGPPATATGTTINASSAPVPGALAAQPGGGFMRSVANFESNYRNIPSEVDKDYPGQPGSKSQGYWQIDTPTWKQFGAAAGIDLSQYPNALSAPADVQEQVARLIPLSRFGSRTIAKLNKQYGENLDKSLTLGELDAKFTTPGGAAPGATAVASSTGATSTATTPAAPQTLWGKLTSKQTDPQTGKTTDSPLQQAAEAFSPSEDKAKSTKELFEEQAPERSMLSGGPGARNVSPGLMNIAQTYGQTLNSFNQPLTWNAAPPRIPGMALAGFQGGPAPVPGISLNSFQPPSQGLGYGIEPIGQYGYG